MNRPGQKSLRPSTRSCRVKRFYSRHPCYTVVVSVQEQCPSPFTASREPRMQLGDLTSRRAALGTGVPPSLIVILMSR